MSNPKIFDGRTLSWQAPTPLLSLPGDAKVALVNLFRSVTRIITGDPFDCGAILEVKAIPDSLKPSSHWIQVRLNIQHSQKEKIVTLRATNNRLSVLSVS